MTVHRNPPEHNNGNLYRPPPPPLDTGPVNRQRLLVAWLTAFIEDDPAAQQKWAHLLWPTTAAHPTPDDVRDAVGYLFSWCSFNRSEETHTHALIEAARLASIYELMQP